MNQKLSVNNFKFGKKDNGYYWLCYTTGYKAYTIYTNDSKLIDDLFNCSKTPTQKFLQSVKKQIKNK
jgi:hypothetical protein